MITITVIVVFILAGGIGLLRLIMSKLKDLISIIDINNIAGKINNK